MGIKIVGSLEIVGGEKLKKKKKEYQKRTRIGLVSFSEQLQSASANGYIHF